MNAPVGAVFYFEYQYGTTKGTVTAGDEVVKDSFDTTYSKMGVAATQSIGTGDGTSVTFYSSSLTNRRIVQGSVSITGTCGGHTYTAIDDSNGSLSGSGIAGGSINYDTGAVTVQFSTAVNNNAGVTVSYQYISEVTAADISQINLDITMKEVRAQDRKLKSVWSTEASDDLYAFHGVSAEPEVIAAQGSLVTLEIDQEILAALWGAGRASGNDCAWSRTRESGVNEIDHLRSMLTSLSRISHDVHKATFRGNANWMVTGSDVCALLDSLPEFVAAPPNPGAPKSTGVTYAGRLAGKWDVYEDPLQALSGTHSDDMDILLGLKGNSWLDAGYVYAPYVPLQVTPTFLDPNDFSLKKGMRTRYATHLVRNEFYGHLKVENITC